jgi:hypothetical protein
MTTMTLAVILCMIVRRTRIVNACQSFAISGQCDLKRTLWA